MIINHNLPSLNAQRNMGINNSSASKSMEKLSSGMRINRAGDDAAGLAISEKMRAQIRGLDQASSNAQNGISMIQTTEGALNETHSILQRMRELATQASNDTNVGVDRGEIQKEINQLSSEINRIGNTTEFNTQSLLKGDGTQNLAKTSEFTDAVLAGGTMSTNEASQTIQIKAAAANGNTLSVTLNGQQIDLSYVTTDGTHDGKTVDGSVTGNAAKIYTTASSGDSATEAKAITDALNQVIQQNSMLKGGYTVTVSGATITIAAIKGSQFSGSTGNIAASTGASALINANGAASVGTDSYTAASATITLDSGNKLSSAASVAEAFIGKGMMVGKHEIEFYDASKGVYTGSNIGVDIQGCTDATAVISKIVAQVGAKFNDVVLSSASDQKLVVTSKLQGALGNGLKVSDGGVQQSFQASFQVGANQGQQMTIEINDMRAAALKVTGTAGSSSVEVTGAKFTTANTVTNGTDNTAREAALDVSSSKNASAAIKVINNAIEAVSSQRAELGAFQNRLEHTINNLGTSSENLTAAESRIRDVDMAKEMSEYSKNNILAQAAQAMLAQANQQPQQVLQLLR